MLIKRLLFINRRRTITKHNTLNFKFVEQLSMKTLVMSYDEQLELLNEVI